MANRNWSSAGKFYSMHTMPVFVDCNFIVDSTNGNGLGIRSLTGPTVKAVYMHTSASPAVGNPNPAAGGIIVQLQDNYNRYLAGFSGQVSPVGTSSTSSVAHAPSLISVLGTATLAQWQAVGLPQGLVPAVGLAFVPTSSAVIGGSAQLAQVAATGSGIDHIEIVGDPNQSIAPIGTVNQGASFLMNCFLNNAIAQPADGTVISLSFILNNSSVKS